MANLKLDLVNKLNNDKFYEELELVRLAQDPTMNYKKKIGSMTVQLRELALLNAELGLVEQYFQEPVAATTPNTVPPAVAAPVVAHNGQSHGE